MNLRRVVELAEVRDDEELRRVAERLRERREADLHRNFDLRGNAALGVGAEAAGVADTEGVRPKDLKKLEELKTCGL
jgi:hypothetical protein